MYARQTRHIRTFLPFVLVLLVWLLPLTVSAGIGTEIGKFIYEAVVAATGTLLTVAAYIFESALTHFVWGFGQYYREFFGFAIETSWAVVRDLMNFMFIFGLIYIGFRFILNADDSQAKNNLVMLILAALLVNFSLFFAKAVVDISHLAAQQLQAPIETVSGDTDISYGNALLNSLQITSILSDDVIDGKDDVPFMWIIGVTILSGVLILVAAFTLAALGIMLFTRFIYLTFLLIFSPVMFIGWIFPGLRGLSSKWLNTFISQALLAPALLLCLYISLSMIALIGQINGVGDEPLTSLHGAPAEDSTTIVGNAAKNAVPFFILGIGFFIGSLIAAKKMGAVGASASISFGKEIGNKARGYAQRGAGNATFGTAAWAGRRTAGWAGNRLVQNTKGDGYASRTLRSIGNKARTSSFDARQVGGLGKELGIGTGKKGGYAQRQKDINKKEQERADLYAEAKSKNPEELYKDAGVDDIHNYVAETENLKNQKLARLNNVKDSKERDRLVSEIDQHERNLSAIKSMEGKTPKPAGFIGSDAEWNNHREKIMKYNKTKKDMKKILQNQYAASLNERGKNLPKPVRGAYRLLGRSEAENKTAANTIRKELNKEDTDKIVDALKENNKKSDE